MARIRTVKPEFWKHEELSALPEATHMLAASLLNFADDEGYFNANARLIHAECCPLREPSVSIHDSLTSLANIGYIRLGTAKDGKRYGQVVTFEEHQRVNRKTPSKIKVMDIVWDDSLSTHTQLTEGSPPEGKGKEGERKEDALDADASHSVFQPPATNDEADLFRRGKQILGPSSGGLVKKLIAAKGNSIPLARSAIELAATKGDPREYIGSIVSGARDSPEELRRRGDAW